MNCHKAKKGVDGLYILNLSNENHPKIMDRDLALEFVRVTEVAALASAVEMGRGDEKKADQAAVDAMRRGFDIIDMKGTIVIGEGGAGRRPQCFISVRR